MLYFKSGQYSLTEKGSLCPGSPGKRSIATLETCQNAMDFVQKSFLNSSFPDQAVTEESESVFPKGCYVLDNDDGTMDIFFNTPRTGSSEELSREICITGM